MCQCYEDIGLNHQVITPKVIELQSSLTYEEEQLRSLLEKKRNEKQMSSLVKILWRHHNSKEETWEREEMVRQQYPQVFMSVKFWGGNLVKGERIVTSVF